MELHKLLHRRIGGIKSNIHSEQLEDKIVKLERRNEPLNRQTPQSYTQQNLCAKIYQYDLYWPLPPYEHCFVEIGCKLDIIKGTYKAGVSYVLAYQVYNNSWSSFNTILTPIPPHFRLEPGFDPRIDIPPSPHHHHITTIPSLNHTLCRGFT